MFMHQEVISSDKYGSFGLHMDGIIHPDVVGSRFVYTNASSNTDATFELFCHLNRARTRTRKTVDDFGLSKRLVIWSIWSFGIMA